MQLVKSRMPLLKSMIPIFYKFLILRYFYWTYFLGIYWTLLTLVPLRSAFSFSPSLSLSLIVPYFRQFQSHHGFHILCSHTIFFFFFLPELAWQMKHNNCYKCAWNSRKSLYSESRNKEKACIALFLHLVNVNLRSVR